MLPVVNADIESLSADVTVMCKVSRVQLHVPIQLTFRRVSFITQSAGKVVAIDGRSVLLLSSIYFYFALNALNDIETTTLPRLNHPRVSSKKGHNVIIKLTVLLTFVL